MKKILFFVILSLPVFWLFLGLLVCFFADSLSWMVIFTLLILLSVLVVFFYFWIWTKNQPLNDLKDYDVNVKIDLIDNIENNILRIELNEIEKDIWAYRTKNGIKIFDLSGYLFPKKFIFCFFFRAFNYPEINRKKAKWRTLGKSHTLSYLKRYDNVQLIFHSRKGKEKNIFVVKNRKTKFSFLGNEIIWANYYDDLNNRHGDGAQKFNKYKKLNEREFLRENKKKKPSIKEKYQGLF